MTGAIGMLLQPGAVALAAALVAGYWPTSWPARQPMVEGLKEEERLGWSSVLTEPHDETVVVRRAAVGDQARPFLWRGITSRLGRRVVRQLAWSLCSQSPHGEAVVAQCAQWRSHQTSR